MDMEAVEESGRSQRPDQGTPHANIPNVLKMSRSDSTVSTETEHEQMTADDAFCTLATLGGSFKVILTVKQTLLL